MWSPQSNCNLTTSLLAISQQSPLARPPAPSLQSIFIETQFQFCSSQFWQQGTMMQCLSGRQLLSHAVSSTHVAPQITPRPLSCANVNVTVARGALRRLVMVRAESTDTSTSTSTAEPELEPPASEDDEFAISPTPPAPKSIITEDNIISALTGDDILIEDHYGRLGVDPEASTSEIITAYQERCAEVNQRELEESESQEILNKLKDSVDLLMSEEERRMYDWCLLRKATHTVEYAWPYEADLSQRDDDPNSLDVVKEDDGVNAKVGLFFLGWFVLSCVLSLTVGK